ncbi:tyrosine-type recombinase/integrase [Amycolatopsis sp. RTGN1]|uniref:tyrosine-type recombinase/integrase n=1 Tax=Amycolatopsis ponsaeliensis TaxID=2992142 RepID=UPI002551B676|nr:site-specific integrase [Amycolatopsis sp. RTGN1]
MSAETSIDERAVAAAAEIVLAKLGLSLDQVADVAKPKVMPTFAEYAPEVAKTTPASSSETWKFYWKVLVDEWGDRPIDEPRASEINQLANLVQQRAAAKSPSYTGQGARSLFIDAVKCFYRCAAGDKLITLAESPVATIKNSKHRNTSRRALTPRELTDINRAAASSGPDPLLDSLLLRLHSETACRAGGALNLRRRDLNPMDCSILLREKGGKNRRQPVSPTLFEALLEHINSRVPGCEPNDQVLRLRNGIPLHYHNYQTFWNRIWRVLPWAKALGVTSHWLRYTTLTWVERSFGYAVAAAYAGHAGPGTSSDRGGVTLTYTSATIHEVAAALSALTGEPHPLAEFATLQTEAIDIGARADGPPLPSIAGTSEHADNPARLRGDQ